MADVVGRIGPAIDITETDEFDAPTRTVNLIDTSGRLHGRIQWLSDEVNESFHRSLLQLCVETMTSRPKPKSGRSPSAAS